MNLQNIIKNKQGTVVDVRTPEEFMGGHVANSVNIPLLEIPYRLEEVNHLIKPLILCCASGNRSGHAAQFMTELGIECYNGGSWMDVNFLHAQAEEEV